MKKKNETRRSGTRHRWDGVELVENIYLKYWLRVLHLARVFAYFWGNAKSKSSEAFEKFIKETPAGEAIERKN